MNDHPRADTCLLALTRPALVHGVPIEAMAINVICTFAAGGLLSGHTLWRSPFMFWVMGPLIHLALRRLTAWDWFWFSSLKLWVKTAARPRLESLPTQPAKSWKDVSSSV